MEIPFSKNAGRKLGFVLIAAMAATVALLWSMAWVDTYNPRAIVGVVQAVKMSQQRHRYELFIEPAAKSVVQVANDIRTLEPDPNRQAYLLWSAARLIHYRLDWEVWDEFFHPSSPSELEALREANGWPAMHGDCKAIAIFTASIAANLGIPYRLAHGPAHMWLEVKTAEGWLAINRDGRKSEAIRDIGPQDWKQSETEEQQRAFTTRLATDRAADAAFTRLFQPPADPEAWELKRFPDVRESLFNRWRPFVFAFLVFVACMAGDTICERRQLRRAKRPAWD